VKVGKAVVGLEIAVQTRRESVSAGGASSDEVAGKKEEPLRKKRTKIGKLGGPANRAVYYPKFRPEGGAGSGY